MIISVECVAELRLRQTQNKAKLTKGIIFRLMSEPRGHKDMYGAILVQDTELTRTGEADIGVLFCHNGR